MNQYLRNGYMGDNEPSNNILRKTKHTKSSLFSCRIELEPVETFYVVGWIEKTRNTSG